MTVYRAWTDLPPPELARFWYAMLEECGLLGSGAVPDWQARLTEHFRTQMQAGTMQWFVAENDSRIVGTAAAILSHGDSSIFKDRTATLAGIYVEPEHRKRGIARELTLRAIDWCKQQGCVSVRLRASAAGRPLYESLGFIAGDEMVLSLR
jgi:GNAT superfamily N-acetyltransferase